MKLKILLILLSVLMMTSCAFVQNYIPSSDNVSNNETIEDKVIPDFEIILNDEVNQEETENVESTLVENKTVLDLKGSLFTVKVKEGEKIVLNLEAKDPDGDDIVYSYSDPLDNDGVWQTKVGDAGTYMTKVSASDGLLTTTETVILLVEALNKAPMIECPVSLKVKEGELIKLACSFVDLEGDKITYEVKGFMNSLEYQTTYDDAGKYVTTVIATDGMQTSDAEVEIIIENVNRAPKILFEETNIVASEKDEIKIEFEVEDLDGDEVEVTFSEPFDEDGIWETKVGDAGEYEVEVTISDGEAELTEVVMVKVNEFNAAPKIEIDDVLTYKENDLIVLPLKVTDPNDDEVSIKISGFMTDLSYQTTYDDEGEYEVTITANDGFNEVSKTIKIVIENVNRPPVFVY